MPLQLDYFYGGEADQFNFYRIPKVLFIDEHFKDVSVEAKILYGLMLDRMSLSVSNEWFDPAGRVYIYFTLEDAIELLCFGKNKVIRLFKELIDIGLIERRKQGQGHPARIYVKNFVIKRRSGSKGHTAKKEQPSRLPKTGSPDFPNREVKTSQRRKSRLPAVESADCPKANPNYTESKDTDMSDTDLSFLPFAPSYITADCRNGRESNGRIEQMDGCREEIKGNIEYEHLLKARPYDEELIDGYVELMTEVCCCKSEQIRIGRNKVDTAVARMRMLSLTREHIVYVLDCMQQNTTSVKNVRAYMLTALYNAPSTMGQHYALQVNHDLATE